MSSQTIVYKGLMLPNAISDFYKDIGKKSFSDEKPDDNLIVTSLVEVSYSKLLMPTPLLFSIGIIALIYFGIIGMDIFNPIKETNLTKSVSYDQAIKKCSAIYKNEKKHGFLYNLIFGQKGGDITKQLKHIGKKIH